MDYLPVIILSIMVIFLIVTLVVKSKTKVNSEHKDTLGTAALAPSSSGELQTEYVHEDSIVIPIERLPSVTEIDEKALFEITDRTIIARISEVIPAAAETAAKTIKSKNLNNAELYKAIIPSGATLTKSKQMEGAVRGIYHGSEGVKGHANLVRVSSEKISKTTTVANGVANVMNVGSLVVGQYYMSEINSKLKIMTKSIDRISDFQERGFKSRIFSLLCCVEEISRFSSEIMENDEQRKIKLAVLENLKSEDIELLEQVNSTIVGITEQSLSPEYKEYQEKVDEFKILVEYQKVLVSSLGKISEMTYLLGRGSISSARCFFSFNSSLERSMQAGNRLKQWHEKQIKALKIDLDKNRMLKSGAEGLFSAIPALIDEKWKYKNLGPELTQKINIQSKSDMRALSKSEAVYDDDVQLIIKDGKYYYLHQE